MLPDDWRKVIFRNPVHKIKEISITTHQFYIKNQPNEKYSPLFISAEQGNFRLSEYIIRKIGRYWANWKDSKGFTPIYIAAQKGHFRICKLILENI